MGKEAARKKKCVCNELLPSDKSACRLFSPFSAVLLVDFFSIFRIFVANVAKNFPRFKNSIEKYLNGKLLNLQAL